VGLSTLSILFCSDSPRSDQLQKRDPDAAINLLRASVKYDFVNTYSFDSLYPAYIRGLAYLESGDGRSAAAAFQKMIDNPGLCWEFVTGPLARLQLGRAERLIGDNASTRKSYEGFLTIWKDTDPDLPIHRQAKDEYAELLKNIGSGKELSFEMRQRNFDVGFVQTRRRPHHGHYNREQLLPFIQEPIICRLGH